MEHFNEKLKLHYKNIYGSESESLVPDGIIDEDQFTQAKYKILWVLKEPYGEGGFSYSDYIKDSFKFGEPYPTSGQMWHKITYTNYGILNGFMKWSDMGALKEDNNIFNALKSSALINLKKIVGGTTSLPDVIREAYEKSKQIIHEQIKIINPDIIICGGTFGFIKPDLKFISPFGDVNEFGFLIENRILINAYHPSYPYMNQERYCDEIIGLCKEFIRVYRP